MGVLISLSGFDGVGKSTQVELLSKYLKSRGKKVKTTEAMFGYFLLKPVIKTLRAKTGSPKGGPVRKNRGFLPKLWFILAFVDIWTAYFINIRPLLERYDFLIADRYYTDIWANLLYYGYLPDRVFNFFVKLLPKPDLALILKVAPKIVLNREREFSPSYYREQEKIYERLSDQFDFDIVNANQSPEAVFEEIKEKIKSFL